MNKINYHNGTVEELKKMENGYYGMLINEIKKKMTKQFCGWNFLF